MWIVPLLLVAGLVLAALLLPLFNGPSLDALWTTYGLLLFAKLAAFAGLMFLGALNKWRLGLRTRSRGRVPRPAYDATCNYLLIAGRGPSQPCSRVLFAGSLTRPSRSWSRLLLDSPSAERATPDGRAEPGAGHGETSYRGHGRLAGRVALVTEADPGIGRAVAIAFAREGVDLVLECFGECTETEETARWVIEEGRRAIISRAICKTRPTGRIWSTRRRLHWVAPTSS